MKLCGFDVGPDRPFFLIAGPCVIESEQLALDTAAALKEICARLDIPFIYKSSFDKANRSSGDSFRGLGVVRRCVIQDVGHSSGIVVHVFGFLVFGVDLFHPLYFSVAANR